MTHQEPRLPNCVDLEKAILGSVIRDPSVLVQLADLHGQHFFDDGLGQVFDVLQTMHEAGEPICDVGIVVEGFRRAGILHLIGGARGIAELIREGVDGHELHYKSRIRAAADLRALIALSVDVMRRCQTNNADPAGVTALIEARIAGLGQESQYPVKSAAELARELIADIRKNSEAGTVRGIPSGLHSLDSKVGLFQPGEVILIAARTSIGKTSLATQFAEHAATRTRALIASLEMRGTEVVSRILAADSGVDSRRLRTQLISDDDLVALDASASELDRVQLAIWSPASATIEQVRAVAKLEQARRGLGFLVLDYVGRVKPTDPRRDRHEQISHISNSLKSLAQELSIPVVACVQLNREADSGVPRLSHLAQSSDLERDADIVLLLHRERLHEPEAELIVAKHRNSVTGSIPLTFDGSATRYRDRRTAAFDSWNQ